MKISRLYRNLLLLLLLFCSQWGMAQLCQGGLGDPISAASTSFGSNEAMFGSAIGETSYKFVEQAPQSGEYTIVNTTKDLSTSWPQNITNHTPNDNIGYMMLVSPGGSNTFYQKNIVNTLCPNSTYEFSAYIISIVKSTTAKPNIKLIVENDGVVIKEFESKNINTGDAKGWLKAAVLFTTPPTLGIITLKLAYNDPVDAGIFAVDDIALSGCGPIALSYINKTSTAASLCAGYTLPYEVNGVIGPGFNDPVYQWQLFSGSGWANVPGANKVDLTVNFSNTLPGIYRYRLNILERSKLGSPECSVNTNESVFEVLDAPVPKASKSGDGCEGGDVQLFCNTTAKNYLWTGPNNFSSNLPNPILKNVKPSFAGTYRVEVFNDPKCIIKSEVDIKIFPASNASTNISAATICDGKSVQLEAVGGINYSWTPSKGLSDPNIANPIASPSETTTYTVNIFNGNCSEIRDVSITVLKEAVANAGNDKKMLLGESIPLTGTITGDKATRYYWTPADYLDDPYKLSPTARPSSDITYTFHVESDCGITQDEVFVKVFPKLEIPNLFTPNGDGINDKWSIPLVSDFPNRKLVVVNRYGKTVFEGYKDSAWDGKSNGKDVPSGTYFYTLYLNNHQEIYSGWVVVAR